MDRHSDITYALVDHITSPSAIVIPVKEVVRVCQERGVRAIVDGAHSPGQLPLNMAELGADYYIGIARSPLGSSLYAIPKDLPPI